MNSSTLFSPDLKPFNSTNNSTTTNLTSQLALWARYSSVLAVWYCVVLFVTALCGILNLIFFASIAHRRNRRSGSDVLIGHLTLLEAIHCLINIPINTSAIYTHSQSLYNCRIAQFFFVLFNVTIFWTLFFLSVNRFVAIVIPFQYPKFTGWKGSTSSIVSAWIIGISLTIPMEFDVGGSFSINRLWGGCVANTHHTGQFDYRPVQTALRTFVPVSFTCALYIGLLGKAWLKSRQTGTMDVSGTATNRSRAYRRKVTLSKLLFMSAILYCGFFFVVPIVFRVVPPAMIAGYPMLQNWIIPVYILGHAVHPVFLTTNSAAHCEGIRSLLRQVGCLNGARGGTVSASQSIRLRTVQRSSHNT